MKKYIFLAASALTLASCSSDDFLGDTPGSTPTSANSAIKFDGNAGKISRATSNEGTAEKMLDYQFKIYGVKSGATTETGYKPVFQDYLLWYDNTSKDKTTTNKSGWEYVGETGEHGTENKVNLTSPQTIKFWDYASADYRFVAGAPSNAFTFIPGDDYTLGSAKITSLTGHIKAKAKEADSKDNPVPSPVYVAEPVVVKSTNYKNTVEFKFVRQQTMVRVGIYETIPGYHISNIKFYPYDENNNAFSSTSTDNIVLTTTEAKYFKGGDNVSGKINYDWSKATPEYTFEYETTGLTESKNWYGGKFESGVPATTSTETKIKNLYGTDGDMHANGYFTVLPTPSTKEAMPILIKCDYTLTADDGKGETIEVKGATAAIPEAYSKWNTNTLYTYIFKISENTNGYTGEDSSHTGLYPITFNAVVAETEFGMQGTITTFTAPSITTHQIGSVTDNGIEYKTGTDITVTVTDAKGSILALTKDKTENGNVAVYKLSNKRTEADLQLESIKNLEFTPTSKKDVTLGTDSKSFTFKPDEAGYYAIQYLTKTTPAEGSSKSVYTYKVVKVVAAPATTTE